MREALRLAEECGAPLVLVEGDPRYYGRFGFRRSDEAGIEAPAKTLTFSSLFPLILDDLDPSKAKRLIDDHLLNEREFWLPYPLPSLAATDRKALNDEVNQLVQEINRVASTTTFNGLKILDGSYQGQQFQVGANANQTTSQALTDIGRGATFYDNLVEVAPV